MALTPAQYLTLKAAIAAETDPTFVAERINGETGAMAAFYNTDSTFIVWKTLINLSTIGNAFVGTEFSGLTTANVSRLSALAEFSAQGINPSTADRRQMFADIFGVNSATNVALIALWKRAAKRGEQLFATGTGTNATPGLLVFEGNISNDDILTALRS